MGGGGSSGREGFPKARMSKKRHPRNLFQNLHTHLPSQQHLSEHTQGSHTSSDMQIAYGQTRPVPHVPFVQTPHWPLSSLHIHSPCPICGQALQWLLVGPWDNVLHVFTTQRLRGLAGQKITHMSLYHSASGKLCGGCQLSKLA